MSRTLLVSAMSGGVDSTVATALMLEAGYEVIGVTLKLKDAFTAGQCGGAPADDERIRQVAATLGIHHEFLDYRNEFRTRVLDYSWAEYRAGRTPNPCAMCNRELKFGLLAEYARQCGAAGLITGHYADVRVLASGEVEVFPAADAGKNQVYFLSLLRREQLAYARMPLATWLKHDVRAKARELGVVNAEARESQDACFTYPGEAFPASLGRYFAYSGEPGDIVDTEGRKLGRHRGLHLYTVGQRKGLDVAMGVPAYILRLDVERNQVVLTTDAAELLCRKLVVREWNELAELPDEWMGLVQFRYRQTPRPARVRRLAADRAEVELLEPVSRPAAGQVAALFADKRLAAGAIIESIN